MSDAPPPEQPAAPGPAPAPQARVERKSQFSLIWILPAIAIVIGAYLAYTTLSQRGPEIVLTFLSADGLTAGQTKVRHKAVDLGTVQSIRLAPDMSHVIVRVRMNRESTPYLTDQARFWVVRPRLSASNISGLETLLSGGYIELDPGQKDGNSQREFVGLEDPPGIRSDEPGRTFVLAAGRIGSLGSGSPVFYRDIVVGEVLGYKLPEGNGPITVNVFVRAPYDKWVRTGTRFWNASGVRVELGPQGVHLELESIQAVLSGGIAFNTPHENRDSSIASVDAKFPLYEDEAAANAAGYTRHLPFVTYFESSAAGLAVGAPVQVFGITVGTVTAVKLELDPKTAIARVRVAFDVQPDRLQSVDNDPADTPDAITRHLVANGMRAALETANLLTGALVVSLEFPPNPPPAEIGHEGDAIVLPSQGGGIAGLTTTLSDIAQKLDALPFAEIGANANKLLASLNTVVGGTEAKQALSSIASTMADVQALVKNVDAGVSPLLKRLPQMSADLQQTVARTNRLVGSVDAGYGGDSQFQRDLGRLMAQLNDTARSIRLLADFLDRHPEALIRGRAAQGASQ
ncbi:MAG: MlaD family protein [Acetobacteraceae bacterium]